MSQLPCIWTIVLNYNQKDLTAACLKSLTPSDCSDLRVIVVDNGSTDGSAALVRREFPWVQVVVNERNLGFAGGNNVGIRYALAHGADLIWLLNNDTEVALDCATELARASMAHPECALFAPKTYYYDRPRVLWYAGGDIRLDRPMGVIHSGMGMRDDGSFNREKEISFVTGCALVIRKKAVEAIGFLDEDIFAYLEDLDWSIKVREKGYKALYVPSAKVWHKVSQTTLASPRGQQIKTYLFARNRFVIQRRYSSVVSLLTLIPKYLGCGVARRAYRALASGEPDQVIALLQGIVDGIRDGPRRYPRVGGQVSGAGRAIVRKED